MKKREVLLAKRSMLVAAVFGLIMSVFLVVTGDRSARLMAHYQPVKFAAMENLYEGQTKAPLVAIGLIKENQAVTEHKKEHFFFKIEIPNFLSYMAFLNANAYVAGINDLVHGNPERNLIPTTEKMAMGKTAISALKTYKEAKKAGNQPLADSARTILNDIIPPIKLTFYSFRIMVGLGFLFVAVFILTFWLVWKDRTENKKWFCYIAVFSIPLAYLATQMGWLVAEVGRQPWIIQDLMPTSAAVSHITAGSVQVTFVLFVVTFTILLIAEIKIMLKQIKKGPKEGGIDHV
jgi:cytochrome d ubiquinol oxidase subunit I